LSKLICSNRPAWKNHGVSDSLVNLTFNLANSWLGRFKTLNRIAWATPLDKTQVPWKLDILNDDGTAAEKEDGKWRTLLASLTVFKWPSSMLLYGTLLLLSEPITSPSHPMNYCSTLTHYCLKLDQQLC
jgi:hypothetical protein